MVVPRLIERKRDGHALEPAEWSELIRAYAAGQVPDYQMSALLLAICFRGLEPAELAALTDAMLASGDRLHFDGWSTPRVDKHSTGGVGDKTSLLLAPMLAAAGVAVPMMSGRGLGHTGGTLDKLEAIRGFRTDISLREAEAQVRRLNCALIGQTPEIAPADKRLYALRDVTATVESIPLIAASIMSKKLAEGLDGLVLDVKTGSGAFLPSVDDALTLARTMVGIGESRGCKVVALLTAMDRPLGRAAGNALEVREAVAGLRGHGPEEQMEVHFALGIEMLRVAGLATDAATARHLLRDTIQSGRALERLMQVVEAQGGDPAQIEHPERLPSAPVQELFTAPEDGVVVGIEPRAVGRAIVALGGGRATMDDVIDPSVGFVFRAVAGEAIKRGQPLVEIHARTRDDAEGAARALAAAITLGEHARLLPLVSHRVTSAGVEELS
jgi:pyrimidine-nucleoside phosphorylase